MKSNTNDHGDERAAERFAKRAVRAARRASERFCERHARMPREEKNEEENTGEGLPGGGPLPTTVAGTMSHLERGFAGGARWMFWASLAVFALWVSLHLVAPEAVLAQQGDGGRIQSTIDNARNWLSGIMVSLGGLGMIGSIAVKAVARGNQQLHHASHMGMTGSGIAIIAGLLINDIISLLQSFVGG